MLYKSALMTQASGSIGGLTASHNRGGQYFRARVIPTNPGTPKQEKVRILLALLADQWLNRLTLSQRVSWDNYAKEVPLINPLGDPVVVTGLNHYIRSNLGLMQVGPDSIDDAPAIFNLGEFTGPSMNARVDPSTIDIAFEATDDWVGETGAFMMIYSSRPVNLSINYFRGPYRLLGSIIGDTAIPPTSPANFPSPFPYEAGQRIFAAVRVVRADARLSTIFRMQADTSAVKKNQKRSGASAKRSQ